MPCLSVPTLPIPKLPSPFSVGTPAVSLSLSTPAFSADLLCCQFSLLSVGIDIELPPLGVTVTIILAVVDQIIEEINAFIRLLTIDCPF